MVASTCSCATPNLVIDIVRSGGVAGNGGWWAFLFAGRLTFFVYVKLWQRSALDPDLDLYDVRIPWSPHHTVSGVPQALSRCALEHAGDRDSLAGRDQQWPGYVRFATSGDLVWGVRRRSD